MTDIAAKDSKPVNHGGGWSITGPMVLLALSLFSSLPQGQHYYCSGCWMHLRLHALTPPHYASYGVVNIRFSLHLHVTSNSRIFRHIEWLSYVLKDQPAPLVSRCGSGD